MKSIYAIAAIFVCLMSFQLAKAESTSHSASDVANVLENEESGQDKDRQLIDALISDLELDESEEGAGAAQAQADQDSDSSELLQAEKRMQYRYGRSMGYRYGKRSAMPYRFGKRAAATNANSWYLSNESRLMPESKMKLRRFIEFLKARDMEETKNKRLTYRYGR